MNIQELKNLIKEELIRAVIREEIGFSSGDTAEWGNFYTNGNGLDITIPYMETSEGQTKPILQLPAGSQNELVDFLESHFQFSEAGDLELTKDPNIVHATDLSLGEAMVSIDEMGNINFVPTESESQAADSIIANLVFDEVYQLYTFLRSKS
jgi:hypothetical protein